MTTAQQSRRTPRSHARVVRRPSLAARIRSVLVHLFVLTIAVFVLVPIMYGALGGFKDNAQLSANPLGMPNPWVPENYTEVLSSGAFWEQLFNSMFIALMTSSLVVILSSMAAYIFARFAFRGREFLFTLFTTGLMFPFAVAILPLFVLLRAMGLLDNPFGVVLPQVAFGLPLTIIVLRQFFRNIPAELEEAAILDGCSAFGFFWRILLPMARPALATVSVLAIVSSWNNFMLPLVVFTDPNWWTLPVGVQQFSTEYSTDTARVLAFVTLSLIPALVFYAVAERQLVGGLARDTLKD